MGAGFERSRGWRAKIDFALDKTVFDEHAMPLEAARAKAEVKASKRPDLLGFSKPSWNSSTLPENFVPFPERPMMHQLSKYHSLKRFDYDHRAEVLEASDGNSDSQYIGRGSKLQYTERHIARSAPALSISRSAPLHPALRDKARWNVTTGGEPHEAAKAHRLRAEMQLRSAARNSRRHGVPPGRVGAMERSVALIDQERARKKATRLFGNTARPDSRPPLSESDKLELSPSRQVPCKAVTTWSLGGFC
mmetsp:Transcript_24050/g.71518  ORF Transcript_24050/g.71518 Transcript_24050/m.71518 type:complete len:249 (-) Transcript_24050:245-991(-)